VEAGHTYLLQADLVPSGDRTGVHVWAQDVGVGKPIPDDVRH